MWTWSIISVLSHFSLTHNMLNVWPYSQHKHFHKENDTFLLNSLEILRKHQNAANKMQRDVSIDDTALQYTNNTRGINLREIYTVYFAAYALWCPLELGYWWIISNPPYKFGWNVDPFLTKQSHSQSNALGLLKWFLYMKPPCKIPCGGVSCVLPTQPLDLDELSFIRLRHCSYFMVHFMVRRPRSSSLLCWWVQMANAERQREWDGKITKRSDEWEGGVEVMTRMGRMRDERMVWQQGAECFD